MQRHARSTGGYVVKIGMVQSAGHPSQTVVALSSLKVWTWQELKQERASKNGDDEALGDLVTPLTLHRLCA